MILLSFLPAIGWGLMPVIASKTKSNPSEQLLGTTIIAFLFSCTILFFTEAILSFESIVICGLSGFFWSCGQYLQFVSFKNLSISQAMPISNGTQLFFTTVFSVVVFGEWIYFRDIIFGIFGLLFVVIGIVFVAHTEKSEDTPLSNKKQNSVIVLLLSSVCFMFYVSIPRLFLISGINVVFPQACGMLISSLLITKVRKDNISLLKIRNNFLTGFLWSIANFAMFLVIPFLGVSFSFTISQFCVVVSIYSSIFFLKEYRTKKELPFLLLGTILIILGILFVSLGKK